LLHLEDDYYNDGYRLGVEDGSRAGRIEGRVFGLEKGFEKFVGMGQLNGRACVWAARMPQKATREDKEMNEKAASEKAEQTQDEDARTDIQIDGPQANQPLHVLPLNVRLEKHISTLYHLSEAESLSTENNEDAVSDFDDRFKRAQSKAKVIQNIIKERSIDLDSRETKNPNSNANSKDQRLKITRAATVEKNMEDFGAKQLS